MKDKKLVALISALVILLIIGAAALVIDANKNMNQDVSENEATEYSSDRLIEIQELLDIVGIYYKNGSYYSNDLNKAVNGLIKDDKKSKYEVLMQNVIVNDDYLVDEISFIGGGTFTYVINNVELEKIAEKYNITDIDSLFDEDDIEVTDNIVESSIDTDGNVTNVFEKQYKLVYSTTSVDTGGLIDNNFKVIYGEDGVSIENNNCEHSSVDDSVECCLYTYVFKLGADNKFYLEKVKSIN